MKYRYLAKVSVIEYYIQHESNPGKLGFESDNNDSP